MLIIQTNYRIIFLISLFSVLSFSCGQDDAELLEKERREMYEKIDGKEVTLYKSMKIMLRSAPLLLDYSEASMYKGKDEDLRALLENKELFSYMVSSILEIPVTDSRPGLLDYIGFYTDISEIDKIIKDMDEDDFPTLLESIMICLGGKNSSGSFSMSEYGWSAEFEHLLMAVLIEGSRSLPESFKFYEIAQIDFEKMSNDEIKVAAYLMVAILYIEQDWYYMAEEILTQSINLLEKDEINILYISDKDSTDSSEYMSVESQLRQMHAYSLLLRGYTRKMMLRDDKSELANQDIEGFVLKMEEAGIDNEIVWFAGAYVNINKEDYDKAIHYLTKLNNSDNISRKEKELVEETIKYLEERNPDKAGNFVLDKLFLAKVTAQYIKASILELQKANKAADTEAGKLIMDLPDKIEEEYSRITKTPDVEDIKDKGKEMIDNLFN